MFESYDFDDYDDNGNYDIWKAMENRDVKADYSSLDNSIAGGIQSFVITLFNFLVVLALMFIALHVIVFHVIPFITMGVSKMITVSATWIIRAIAKCSGGSSAGSASSIFGSGSSLL